MDEKKFGIFRSWVTFWVMIISMIVSFTVTFTLLQAKVNAMEDKGEKLRTEYENFKTERIEALKEIDAKVDQILINQAKTQKDIDYIKKAIE